MVTGHTYIGRTCLTRSVHRQRPTTTILVYRYCVRRLCSTIRFVCRRTRISSRDKATSRVRPTTLTVITRAGHITSWRIPTYIFQRRAAYTRTTTRTAGTFPYRIVRLVPCRTLRHTYNTACRTLGPSLEHLVR